MISSLDSGPGWNGMAQSCIYQQRFLDVRRHFFTQRVIRPWNRLLREVVNVLRWFVLKRLLDNILNDML